MITFTAIVISFVAGYFIGVLHTKYRKYNPKPNEDEPDWGAGL